MVQLGPLSNEARINHVLCGYRVDELVDFYKEQAGVIALRQKRGVSWRRTPGNRRLSELKRRKPSRKKGGESQSDGDVPQDQVMIQWRPSCHSQ